MLRCKMNRIDKVVYINLDKRPDRKAEIEAELTKLRIPADKWVRFNAVAHANGAVGCNQSHIAVLQMAEHHGWRNVLILEDDFTSVVSAEDWEAALAHFFASVTEYDVLMLAYNLRHGGPHNDVVGKVHDAQTTAGYLVHQRFYEQLRATMQEGMLHLQAQPHAHETFALDMFWKRLQPHTRWFYMLRRLGKQRASYSDIENRIVDYGV